MLETIIRSASRAFGRSLGYSAARMVAPIGAIVIVALVLAAIIEATTGIHIMPDGLREMVGR